MCFRGVHGPDLNQSMGIFSAVRYSRPGCFKQPARLSMPANRYGFTEDFQTIEGGDPSIPINRLAIRPQKTNTRSAAMVRAASSSMVLR